MSVGVGRPARIRLFLEGIEVPVISAEITAQPNAPAQCTLQMPASALGAKLLPRTLVHLFFLDHNEPASKLRQYRGKDSQNPKPENPTVYEQARERRAAEDEFDSGNDAAFSKDVRNSRYKLLFAGEIIGRQYVKQPTTRSLVLQCLDLSNYWDYAYQFNNTDLFGPSLKAVFSGGSTNLLTDFLSSPGEIVTSLLHLPSANYPALKGMLGGLIRMIEAIGGCYVQDDKFQGQNIFYSLAELRLHISQMLTAWPKDRTVSRLLGGGYDDMFGRTLGNLGDQVSIRTVLNALMAIIFHQTSSIPSPYFSPGTKGDTLGRERKPLSAIPRFNKIYTLAIEGQKMCEEVHAKAEPSNLEESFASVPAAAGKAAADRLSKYLTTLQTVRNLSRQDPVLKRNKVVDQTMVSAIGFLRTAVQQIRKMGGRWAVKSPDRDKLVVALNKARVLLKKLESVEVDVSDPKTRTPSRLNSHIFHPDIWFAAPPRCNVIFPNMYDSLQTQRVDMQEPTRLLLKLHDEFFGEDELFDTFFFAPRARTQKGKRSTLQALFERDIMEHELYTGILPVFTKMGELNIFALRDGKVNGKQPKIGLAQRSANYLYFKQKFAARQLSVNCFFNPYLAPGFPGLILDTYVDMEKAEAYQQRQRDKGATPTEIAKLLGTHYLGSFTQVTHSLSFQEARTSVGVQYAREYDESTEFFGPAISDDQTILKRLGGDAHRNTYVAADVKPKVGALGPAYGIITRVVDVTDEPGVTGGTFPIYTGPRRKGDPSLDGEARVGVPERLGAVSPKLAIDRGANKMVVFRGYLIFEDIPRYRRDTVDLPAEEYIRPGWVDDCWHPASIGEVYQHYFRTGAITDKAQVGDPDGVSVGSAGQLARDQFIVNATGNKEGDQREGISPAVLSLDINSSVEQAVRYWLLVYSYIIQGGLSQSAFTDAFTYRPIASLPDMFGTSDLELDVRGIKALRGIEGFHSRAFGPYDDAFGLVTPEITEVLGATKSDDIIRKKYDVRGRRFQAVRDYVDALTFVATRGLHAS